MLWIFLSGLPWAGFVQWGGFLFKEFWTRIVFWPDTCLVELTKSYVQFQSLMISSEVLSSVPKVLCSVPKVLCSVPKSYVQVAKSYVQVAKSYVQVSKLSSSVFL